MSNERKYSVEFLVEVETKPWEAVCVVGNHTLVGNWNPYEALPLIRRPSQERQWFNHIDVEGGTRLEYRYFVCQYLDPFKDSNVQRREMVITRWEALRLPRTLLLEAESGPERRVSRNRAETFGHYGGRELVDDGWLLNQSEIRLRIHAEGIQYWKSRYQHKLCRVRVTPVDLRYREIGSLDIEDEDSRDAQDTPLLPSHTDTKVSILTDKDPCFRDQPPHGVLFRPNKDYFVFQTQSVAPEFLAYRFEFFADSAASNSSSAESRERGREPEDGIPSWDASAASPAPERMGFCYLLPSNIKETFGNRVIPITSFRHQPIGQISVDYLLIHPLSASSYRPSMEHAYARHWKKRGTLDVGHRGMGSSYTKVAAAKENTIQSLQAAARAGADFVEFDVQLSKDGVPIIYHDFHVAVAIKRRVGSTVDLTSLGKEPEGHAPPRLAPGNLLLDSEHYELAVKDLKLKQLQLLQLMHVQHEGNSAPGSPTGTAGSQSLLEISSDDDVLETQPFPTLEQVLQRVDPHVGFNVEIKSPMLQKNGEWECDNFCERNNYLDQILAVVMNHAGPRRIIFSSFDPDVCTMLKLKQNKYPVLFLTQGTTTRYMPFLDQRANTSSMAVAFAGSNKILGVNFHSEDLLKDPSPFHTAHSQGLVSFAWGEDLDSKDNIAYFKKLGFDGVIYDKISDKVEGEKTNVFLVEKREKDKLLRSQTPVPTPTSSPVVEVAPAPASFHTPSPPLLQVPAAPPTFS